MCGIVGYVGPRNANRVLLNGLRRLEYRGYDSAGVALLNADGIHVFKTKGRVDDLEAIINGQAPNTTIGIGHTRWATHGEPNDVNAHPHVSQTGRFVVIHNGIIENYLTLKAKLKERGFRFVSETDTEVLAHLIEEMARTGNFDLPDAVRHALLQVEGAFGIVVASQEEPGTLVAAKRGSPIVVGMGEGEYFVASDATPIIEYTRNVVYLRDNELAVVRPDELTIKTLKNAHRHPEVETLNIELSQIEKGGYEHFMLKEIFEQPRSTYDSLRGRVKADLSEVRLGGVEQYQEVFKEARRVLILGCGTSWHAGLMGEYLIEDLARLPVEVEYASEFRYRHPVINADDIVIAISQSGETADTLAAIKLAKEAGAMVFGVCNVVGASIPRETHAGAYTHAGPEIGVASTKAFTAQVTVLILLAMALGRYRGTLTDDRFHPLVHGLLELPDLMANTLEKLHQPVQELAQRYKDASNFLYLGRGYNFPIALEGALKLKEISYIHAEGYPAAEMKHGPIALIDENMPVVVIATRDQTYDKIVSNIQEVKARRGRVIAIVTEGDEQLADMVDHTLAIPRALEPLTPLLAVLPLQLLSYYIAVLRGCDVDRPRNLAKSVTVE